MWDIYDNINIVELVSMQVSWIDSPVAIRLAGGNHRRFQTLQLRYASPVIPGQTLVTEIWDLSSEEFLETVGDLCGDVWVTLGSLHCKLCLLKLERGLSRQHSFISSTDVFHWLWLRSYIRSWSLIAATHVGQYIAEIVWIMSSYWLREDTWRDTTELFTTMPWGKKISSWLFQVSFSSPREGDWQLWRKIEHRNILKYCEVKTALWCWFSRCWLMYTRHGYGHGWFDSRWLLIRRVHLLSQQFATWNMSVHPTDACCSRQSLREQWLFKTAPRKQALSKTRSARDFLADSYTYAQHMICPVTWLSLHIGEGQAEFVSGEIEVEIRICEKICLYRAISCCRTLKGLLPLQ